MAAVILQIKAITIYIYILLFQYCRSIYFVSKYRIKKKKRNIMWLSKLIMPNLSFQLSIL